MNRLIDQRQRVRIGRSPSERVLRVCAAYSLKPEASAPLEADRQHAAAELATSIVDALSPGEIGLVAGPSGSGKSSVLTHLRRTLSDRCIDAGEHLSRLTKDPRAVIDAIAEPSNCTNQPGLGTAIDLLATAGLAEPTLWVRPAATLSDGERARCAIAACVGATRHGASGNKAIWITIDECCALLDDAAAQSVARTLKRWVHSQHRVSVVCASSRATLEDWLAPDRVWRLEL